MDGLECSEVLFSEIKNDNEKYRFDSEFFQKKFLMAYDIIKSQPMIFYPRVKSLVVKF